MMGLLESMALNSKFVEVGMIHNDWEMVGSWDVMEVMGFLPYELPLVHSQNIMKRNIP